MHKIAKFRCGYEPLVHPGRLEQLHLIGLRCGLRCGVWELRRYFFFFFTLVTGPRRSLSLKLSDTKVYEPQTRVMRPLCIQDGSNNSTWSGACLACRASLHLTHSLTLSLYLPLPPSLSPSDTLKHDDAVELDFVAVGFMAWGLGLRV